MARLKVTARHRHKYVVLPVSLLVFNVLHEVIVYKSAAIGNPYLQTLFLMVMFLSGFALVTFVVSPFVVRMIERMHLLGKKGAGLLGELAVAVLFFAAVAYLYYQVYTTDAGVENILPRSWHNSPSSNSPNSSRHLLLEWLNSFRNWLQSLNSHWQR